MTNESCLIEHLQLRVRCCVDLRCHSPPVLVNKSSCKVQADLFILLNHNSQHFCSLISCSWPVCQMFYYFTVLCFWSLSLSDVLQANCSKILEWFAICVAAKHYFRVHRRFEECNGFCHTGGQNSAVQSSKILSNTWWNKMYLPCN